MARPALPSFVPETMDAAWDEGAEAACHSRALPADTHPVGCPMTVLMTPSVTLQTHALWSNPHMRTDTACEAAQEPSAREGASLQSPAPTSPGLLKPTPADDVPALDTAAKLAHQCSADTELYSSHATSEAQAVELNGRDQPVAQSIVTVGNNILARRTVERRWRHKRHRLGGVQDVWHRARQRGLIAS